MRIKWLRIKQMMDEDKTDGDKTDGDKTDSDKKEGEKIYQFRWHGPSEQRLSSTRRIVCKHALGVNTKCHKPQRRKLEK
jgi:hypothetical protein